MEKDGINILRVIFTAWFGNVQLKWDYRLRLLTSNGTNQCIQRLAVIICDTFNLTCTKSTL